jgi:TonB family protein
MEVPMFDALTHRPTRRRWGTLFLIGSLALHAAGAMALIIAAMWKIERLVPDRMPVVIQPGRSAFIEPGPEPAQGPTPPERRKPREPKPPPVPVQPTAAPAVTPTVEPVGGDGPVEPTEPGDGGGGDGTGTCVGDGCGGGTGDVAAVVDRCGDGAVTGAEVCDDGNARAGDGCSATCQREQPRRVSVRHEVIDSLRIAGETRILPPADVQTQMVRSGIDRTRAVLRVCLDASGRVEEARFLKGTGFAGYDQRLRGAVSAWRYRPYSVNGQSVAVCGTVEFVYVQQ